MQDQKIGQLLLQDGVINESQLKKALETQKQSYGKPLGEILINLEMIEEADFLRILAKKFHTQYLTAKKLSELSVPEAVLKMVPANTSEKHNLFPVQYKKADKTLTIVMTNPDNVAAIDEVKFVSGISSVKCLVSVADAIKAAITKWYKGDEHAFDQLLGTEEEMAGYELGTTRKPTDALEGKDSPLDLSALLETPEERTDAKRATAPEADKKILLGADKEEGLFLGGMTDMPGDNNMAREQIEIEEVPGPGQIEIEDMPGRDQIEVEEVMVSPAPAPSPPVEEIEAKPTRRADVKKYRMRMLVVELHESIRKFIVKLFSHEGFKVRGVPTREDALNELSREYYDTLVIKERDLGEGEEFVTMMAERFPEVEICSIKDYGSAIIGETRAQKRLMSSFLETLDILIGLLEMEAGTMQGHSHNAAKYARLIASKLDLPQREVDTIMLAAYIHDLAKKGLPHRSILRIQDADLDHLMEQAEIPLKLLGSAKYPLDIASIIRHQYEQWNGEGHPDQLAGEDIPIGARVLALVEVFEDLTNKYSGSDPLEPPQALEIMKQNSGKLFDPALVDIFLGVVRDDLYLQQMSGGQDRILLVDTEVDLVTLLELRLVNMGFAVSTARTGQEGLDKAKAAKPALIISEADLPDFSGFDMIEKIKSDAATRDIPFLFLSRKEDSNSVTRGFRLGAEDYMVKPVKVDILGAKINTMMARLHADHKTAPAAAGVTGSLSEMGIPDIVQILGAGRKTGRITLQNDGQTASIDLEEGQVVNAAIEDLKGEDAFYKILYWTKGSFSIDPTVQIAERLIHTSVDSLMIEGFRRMDEANRGGEAKEDISLDGSDFF